MVPHRFDALTKTVAQPATRRATLRRLLGGGLTAALLGTRAPGALAQATPAATPTPGTSLCAFGFDATVRQGPDAGQTLAGTLLLPIGSDGAIDQGALLRKGEAPVPVVGQVTGRAVNLLFTVAAGKVIYGVGTAQHPMAGCQPGTLGGPLVGPAAGDSGDWALVASSPALADACSRCLAANYCAGRPGTQPCQDCITNYCS